VNLKKILFILRVRTTCPRLLINNEKVGMQDRLSRFLGFKQGLVFDAKSTHGGRDVAWLGNCDSGCQLLADKLGWGVRFAYIYLLIFHRSQYKSNFAIHMYCWISKQVKCL